MLDQDIVIKNRCYFDRVLLLPLVCWIVSGSALLAEGSGASSGQSVRSSSLSTPFKHRWALDLVKAREKASGSMSVSERFFGVNPSTVISNPALAGAACESEWIVQEGGGPARKGGCFLWWQMQRRNADHSLHVDAPETNPIINIIDGDKKIDPPGYLNIIANFNVARHRQTEIMDNLRNGDILVYFHPEWSNTTDYQMGHAAMYYQTDEGPLAINLGGIPYVHHIDNPLSYGPAFTGGSWPFHVFRFSPNGAPSVGRRNAEGKYVFPCTSCGPEAPAACRNGGASFTITNDMADQYAYAARNWALVTNDHAAFGNYHALPWRDALQRQQSNTGLLAEADRFALPAILRTDKYSSDAMPPLYCAAFAYTNLNLGLNRPMNPAALGTLWNAFSGMTVQFNDSYMKTTIASNRLVDATNLPSLGQLVFEPIPASELIDAWVEGYFRNLTRQQRGMMIDASAEQISSSLGSEVHWVPGKPASTPGSDSIVASPARIREYAQAYAAGGAALAKMKEDELKNVVNRYVPPFAYHWKAMQENSLLSYVGTVVPVDLLSPIGDNDGQVPSGVAPETIVGGPDTGTSDYASFRVPNNGRHVQRVLEVPSGSGPQYIGEGSAISTRISASDIRDIRLVLHPPGTFTEFADPRACNSDDSCIGDAPGISVPIPIPAGETDFTWRDRTVTIPIFTPVSEGGMGCEFLDDQGHSQGPLYDWSTGQAGNQRLTFGKAQGQWALSVIDRGQYSAPADVANCPACPTGGAHTNQWVVMVRNGRPQATLDILSPSNGSTAQNPVSFQVRGSSDIARIDITSEGETIPSISGNAGTVTHRFSTVGRIATVNFVAKNSNNEPIAQKSITITLPAHFEAENYTTMSGVKVGPCSEGGQCVGYVDAGDWLVYSIQVPQSGTYKVRYRVAAPANTTLSSDLNAGATQLGVVNIPATGGWDNWTTLTQTVTLPAGNQKFGIYAKGGQWNLNWIEIEPSR